MANPWSPTRVVVVTLTAIFDESDSLSDDELVDVATEDLAANLPSGWNYAGSVGVVVSVSHAPER